MDLIAAAYGNDSDDQDDCDPWSSSRVSTKRICHEIEERPVKRLTKLPPPRLLSNASSVEHVDIPSAHGDRVRSFPHERGNWASFVHLPWEPREDLLEYVRTLCVEFQKYNIGLEVCDDFHVSLTKTVVLRHHWIEGFVASVRKQLEDVKSFVLYLNDLEVYVNEERTRTFLAFRVSDASNCLDFLVERLDHCMREYQLPEFYKDPAHHVSIAWCLGDRKQELDSILASGVNSTSVLPDGRQLTNWCMMQQVRCKISQMMFVCNLKN